MSNPSSGGVVIVKRYVLPVLWITSCLHTVASNRRSEKRRDTQSDSTGGSTGLGAAESVISATALIHLLRVAQPAGSNRSRRRGAA